MTILLFGANGQVGARIAAQAKDCIALTREQVDLTTLDVATIEKLIAEHQPSHIINAAAYTAVDDAETHQETASAINATAPRILAQAAARHGVRFTHFSTDYVFDGASGAPYGIDTRTNPLGHYGKSKLRGEQAALEAGAIVFRLQWVYDTRGRNFYRTMRALLAERDALRIVADQWGAPTFAPHVANAVLENPTPPGLYHMAPQGFTSWHGFACAIAEAMQRHCTIAPITTTEYPTPAPRPKDTRLDTTHGITLPHWREGLKEAFHAVD